MRKVRFDPFWCNPLSRYVVECKSGLRPPALRYLKKLKNAKSAV